MNVTPFIHEAPYPIHKPNFNSNCHYGWHCGGFSLGGAHRVARDIAFRYVHANEDGVFYPVIELAVIPYSDDSNLYYVEDRSVHVPNPRYAGLTDIL